MKKYYEIYAPYYNKKTGMLFIFNDWKRVKNGKQFVNHFLCKCDCGTIKYLCPRRSLKLGNCGCLGKARRGQSTRTHGKSNTAIYMVYRSMIDRCYNEKSTNYFRYGARGIRVCKRWRDSFQDFYNDIGFAHKKGLTIERIDNNKGYSPKNCKLATMQEQCNNRRSNRIFKYRGKKTTLANASRESGVSSGLIQSRLDRGWSPEKSIETPIAKKTWWAGRIKVFGEELTIMQASVKYNIFFKVISKRLKRGWSPEDAVSQPLGTRLKNRWDSRG